MLVNLHISTRILIRMAPAVLVKTPVKMCLLTTSAMPALKRGCFGRGFLPMTEHRRMQGSPNGIRTGTRCAGLDSLSGRNNTNNNTRCLRVIVDNRRHYVIHICIRIALSRTEQRIPFPDS